MSTPNPTAIDPGHVEAVAMALRAAWVAARIDEPTFHELAEAAILAYTKATSMPVKAGGAGD